MLRAKVRLARIDVAEGRAQQAIGSLRLLMRQADEQGVPNVSVECDLLLAEAMIQARDNAHAQEELDRALSRVDKLGLKPLSAKAHYLLGTILRTDGIEQLLGLAGAR